MKTYLTLEVDYDPSVTDPEGLAAAMDRLLETALSTRGILSEYGDPVFGEFLVAQQDPHGPSATISDIPGGDVSEGPKDGRPTPADTAGNKEQALRQVVQDLLKCQELNQDELEKRTRWVIDNARGLLEDVPQEIASPQDAGARRYILYDFDANELVGGNVYPTYEEALDDGFELNNVIVIAVTLPDVG